MNNEDTLICATIALAQMQDFNIKRTKKGKLHMTSVKAFCRKVINHIKQQQNEHIAS